ncbi:MAG TPA: YfiR family protein [Kofleriaceae bacterium]
MTTRTWIGLGCALVALALGLGVARADEGDDDQTAAARRAVIVLRILAYDRALATRSPGGEVIVFVVAGPDRRGRTERELWQAGFALLPKVKVGGRPVRAIAIDYEDAGKLDALVARQHPAAMIVTEGLGGAASALRHVADARQVIAVSLREAEVRDGYAIGLIAGDKRDEIAINLEAARGEGARFGAGLLQLARIVDGGGSAP